MSMPSNDLAWILIRNNNAMMVKRRHNNTRFSREKFNLRNLSTPKQSGLVNNRSIDIREDGKHVALSTRNGKVANTPAKTEASRLLKKDFRRSASAIKALTDTYRPDLQKAALARYSRTKRSQKPVLNGGVNKPRQRHRANKM